MSHPRRMLEISIVRALEESDAEEAHIPRSSRDAATVAAMAKQALDEQDVRELAPAARRELIARRAQLLLRIDERAGRIGRRVQSGLGLMQRLPWLLAVVAFGAGWASDGWRGDRTLSLLSAPFWGLLGWNLLQYGLLLGTGLFRRRTLGGVRRLRRALEWSWRIGLDGRATPAEPGLDESSSATPSIWIRRALGDLAERWTALAGPAELRRWRCGLHGAAAAAMLGWIAGTYQRGLFLAFDVTWESTWLDASGVQALLQTVLGAAATLSGLVLPDVAPLEAPGRGPAATWIHLFALTGLIAIVLPRIGLVLWEWSRARRSIRRMQLDWDAGYFHRLFARFVGGSQRIWIHPYSFTPLSATVEALKVLLYEVAGARATIEVAPVTEYGESPNPTDDRATARLALFNLAQTPELEVHADWLRGLQADGWTTVALLDGSSLARRGADPQRVAERERAWRLVLEQVGVSGIVLPERLQGAGKQLLIERIEASIGTALRGARTA